MINMEFVQVATCTGPKFVHVANCTSQPVQVATCTSCNLYRFIVHVATCTKSQLVRNIYKMKHNFLSICFSCLRSNMAYELRILLTYYRPCSRESQLILIEFHKKGFLKENATALIITSTKEIMF